MKKLLFIVLFGFFIISVFIISSYSNQKGPYKPYEYIAKTSELIVLGRVDNIEFKKRFFGMSNNDPVRIMYQYVTLDIRKIVKGTPRLIPLVFRTTLFVDDPRFKQNDEIIVMLKWFDSNLHGKYYTTGIGSSRGVFYVKHDGFDREFVYSPSMGDRWKIDLNDFINEITAAQ